MEPAVLTLDEVQALRDALDNAMLETRQDDYSMRYEVSIHMSTESATRLYEVITMGLLETADQLASRKAVSGMSQQAALAVEDSPEVLAAITEAQAVATRINFRLDSIHNDLQVSIMDVRVAHETAAAIRQVGEAA
jgi:hypothetical protein